MCKKQLGITTSYEQNREKTRGKGETVRRGKRVDRNGEKEGNGGEGCRRRTGAKPRRQEPPGERTKANRDRASGYPNRQATTISTEA
ncbi:unnamed protein product [Enterobius vermicularis]|uniref:Uncharacterized protein n=1 Tax=Enterobius vermicularis TaxID=51028 RepID=A0A0N4VBP5_ENTVE|nr:unnamed protein product [Enterobius vermicularis]